jgi:hypothetical protein
MTAPSSAVDICNLALSHLNAGVVADISTNPQTDGEKECQKWYDTTRRGLLRKYVWNFARKRDTVSRGSTPAFGFTDSYNLPIDYIRLLGFGKDDEDSSSYHWYLHRQLYEIERKTILLNNDGETTLRIVYIYDAITVSDYDALFVETLALKLAYKMAYKFTTKKSVVDRIRDELEVKEQEAVSIDGQERPPKRVEYSKFKAARRRDGTSSVASPYTVFRR